MTRASDSAVLETLRDVVDKAGKVFGPPLTQDGLTVLPVAKISSGGGGGGGSDGQESSGAGAGVGVAAKPLGVFVVRDGKVRWLPALDLNRIILGGEIVAVVALLVTRALVKSLAARSSERKKK